MDTSEKETKVWGASVVEALIELYDTMPVITEPLGRIQNSGLKKIIATVNAITTAILIVLAISLIIVSVWLGALAQSVLNGWNKITHR